MALSDPFYLPAPPHPLRAREDLWVFLCSLMSSLGALGGQRLCLPHSGLPLGPSRQRLLSKQWDESPPECQGRVPV